MSRAFNRKASSPPRCSTERSAAAVIRSRTDRCSASDIKVTLQRLGKNRVRVFRLEWLTRLPDWTALPLSSQRRDMTSFLSRMVSGGRGSELKNMESGPVNSDGRSEDRVPLLAAGSIVDAIAPRQLGSGGLSGVVVHQSGHDGVGFREPQATKGSDFISTDANTRVV